MTLSVCLVDTENWSKSIILLEGKCTLGSRKHILKGGSDWEAEAGGSPEPRNINTSMGYLARKDLFPNKLSGARKMARWLRTLTTITKDLGLSSYMTAHDLLTPAPMSSYGQCGCCIYRGHRQMHISRTPIKAKTKPDTPLQQQELDTSPCYTPTVPNTCCYSTLSGPLLAFCCHEAHSLWHQFFHYLLFWWGYSVKCH